MKAKVNKTWVGVTTVIFTMAIGLGFFFNAPVNSFTMDINPSIEILSNRLEKVVEIKPLNEDAEALLLNYSLKDKDLEKVIDDIVDLMILTGYISGGQDNKVTITVSDEKSQKKHVDKVNQMITAYLENKQIEAVVMTQIVDSSTNQNDLTIMADGSTQEKLIEPTSQLEDKQVIGIEVAKKIALGLVNGEIIKFEFDDDDNDSKYEIEIIFEGREYEIEIDAYTGKVLEFDKDDDEEDRNQDNNHDTNTSRKVIGFEAAKKIALDLVNGQVVKFEFDNDDNDSKYEMEIIFEGREYDIEIDAYTGKVIEFEFDDVDDDDDDDND
ncbi:PepSY domain-containing protein [Petrocella sp. FN5]|uniref:PepSY domain-containing protein n=1 Tax=Petrocella sp. FN5 TaxID=3032002 RepID=UPI0023DB7337|nr:PepSY domain-containing protein [Petrocella sp. FN5]MDF1618189.1 PepSY domain-containing protein [Petrocella sp. FN5]